MSKENVNLEETKASQASQSAQAPGTQAMTVDQLETLISRVEAEMHTFMAQEHVQEELTAKERRRLIGSRVRNNGFIDKAFEIVHENPTFMPPNFSLGTLADSERRYELLRQLLAVQQQFQQLTSDTFLLQSDFCYREALRIYGSLREQAKGRVPGAQALFDLLMNFFHRRRPAAAEPTEHQLEVDFRKLIHGKADGEIIIRNETPQTVGGVHEVVDNVRKGKIAIKSTAEEKVS